MARGRKSKICGEDGLWPLLFGRFRYIATWVDQDGRRVFQGFDRRDDLVKECRKHPGAKEAFLINITPIRLSILFNKEGR